MPLVTGYSADSSTGANTRTDETGSYLYTIIASTSSSSYVALLPNKKVEGDRSAQSPENNFGSTVTVYTNSVTGYNLAVKAATNANLVNQSNNSYHIDPQNSALTAGTAGWNYDVAHLGAGETWAPTATGTTVNSLTNQAMSTTDAT